MNMYKQFIVRSITLFALLAALVVGGSVASAARNPIYTNCSGTHCVLDAMWLIFRNADVNNPVTQIAVTTMNTDTAIVPSGIVNQANTKTSFLAGDTLTVPINASGELISTGAQFYDTPPVYFDPAGKFRAIMENVASCSSVGAALTSTLTGYRGNVGNCLNSTPDNSPITGTWSDTWTTTGGAKLTCTTNNDGKTATCTSDTTLPVGPQTITLTRTVKDLKWSAKDVWLNKTGIPTMNLHPFYSTYGYTSLFAGWSTLQDAPMVSSATVNFVAQEKATADLSVSASPTGPFTQGPLTIPTGTKVYLKWTSTNATSCAISGGMTANNLPTTGLNYPTSNISAPSTVFTIICTGPGGSSVPDSVTVLTSAVTPTPTSSGTPTPSPSPTALNRPPVGVATVSADGGVFASSITVTKGKSVSIRLSASGSSDPDGWTTPGKGVSNGGKCEWNSDLNQGAPTFETTIANPASPDACTISLGTLTFNDTPGTYTYNLLRLTDAAGAQSNNGTITVTVLAATPSPSPTASPTSGPTTTPPIDFGDFEETR